MPKPRTFLIRDPSAIDAECQASARVYIAASKHGGLAESTLLALFARVATLMWVLMPHASEVQAQGAAWELIAQLREDGGE